MEKVEEEKLQELIIKLVWSASDGNARLNKELFSHFEEPLAEWKDLINYLEEKHLKQLRELKEKNEEETRYKEALSQFIGFTHAKKGFEINSLVSGMGLTKEEWKRINKDEDFGLSHLDLDDCEEIEKTFGGEQ